MGNYDQELFLINTDTENIDKFPLFYVLSTVAKKFPVKILSSLDDSALKLVNKRGLGRFLVVFDGKLSQNWGEKGEIDEEKEKKVIGAVFEDWKGVKVALMGKKAGKTVLKCCKLKVEGCPAVSRLKINVRTRNVRFVSFYSTKEALFTLFSAFQPHFALPLPHFPYQTDKIASISRSILTNPQLNDLFLPKFLKSIKSSVKTVENRFEMSLNRLNSALIPVKTTLISHKTTLNRHLLELKSLKKSQNELFSVLETVIFTANSSLTSLKVQFSRLEREQNALQASLSAINPIFQSDSRPISIISIQIDQFGVLTAEIQSKKPYKIIGNIGIFAKNEQIYSKTVVFTEEKRQYSLNKAENFTFGRYRLEICAENKDLLAVPFEFEVKDDKISSKTDTNPTVFPEISQISPFEHSFVYKNVKNLQEIEQYLRENFGEFRVNLWREVVSRWENESISGVFPLVSAFYQPNLPDLPSLYAYFHSQGLFFR